MKAPSERAVRAGGLRGAPDLRAIDRSIAVALRWGVLLSAAVIVLGLVLYVAGDGLQVIFLVPPGVLSGVHADPTSLPAVLHDLGLRQPAAVTDLGLLLLIATPVISVIIATAAFGLEWDWLYTGIGFFVFVMLIVSSMLGRAY